VADVLSPVPVEPGKKFQLRCQGCGSWFDWEPGEHWAYEVPSYHSRTCQERTRIRKKRATEYVKCPRPEKVLYRQHSEAQESAVEMCARYRKPFTVYTCVCGGLHVGSLPYRLPRRRRG
jgi:hypothetical protein